MFIILYVGHQSFKVQFRYFLVFRLRQIIIVIGTQQVNDFSDLIKAFSIAVLVKRFNARVQRIPDHDHWMTLVR